MCVSHDFASSGGLFNVKIRNSRFANYFESNSLPFRICLDPLKSKCPPYPWIIILKVVLTVLLYSIGRIGDMLSSRTGESRGLSLENRKKWIVSLAHGSRNCRKHGPSSNSRVNISLMSFSIVTAIMKFFIKPLFILCFSLAFMLLLFLFSPLSPH